MTPTANSPLDRLRDAYRQGGASSVLETLRQYFAWRLQGSPEPETESGVPSNDRVETLASVMLMREWYASASTRSSPTVSIILPTKDRPSELERAIGSVMSQSYQNWELIVINDGEEELSLGTVSADPRIVLLEGSGRGVGAARNRGLDRATGEFLTFLDDDNVMDPHWIKSVVIYAENEAGSDILIGAQMVMPEAGEPASPWLRFPTRFDWIELTRANYIDMAQVAHRPQVMRFDEDLTAFVDWDYVVRLTAESVPSLVPALSGVYFTGATNRISHRDRYSLARDMRRRFASLRDDIGDTSPWGIGNRDALAIATLVRRLGETSLAPLRVLSIGESERIERARSVLSQIEGLDQSNDPSDRDGVDLIVIDDPMPDAPTLVREGGLIVGLSADIHDYASHVDTPSQRRVGDRLWVGASRDVKFATLFDGQTLVRLGLDLDDPE